MLRFVSEAELEAQRLRAALEHLDDRWIQGHAIRCCERSTGWGIWSIVCYHLPSDTFCRLDFECCGVDLSDDRCASAAVISREEAMAIMDDSEKARLETHIKEQQEARKAARR